MEKDWDRFEKLLERHSFDALSDEDRMWVLQHVASAKEYEAMRAVGTSFKHMRTEPIPSPDPSVLASLKHQLHIKEARPASLSQWRVPAWAAVLAVAMVGSAGWYVGAASGPTEIYRDRLVTRVDTVWIAPKPDTVILERIRYRQVQTLVPVTQATDNFTGLEPSSKGVSMKEKEELEKLLVSGGW